MNTITTLTYTMVLTNGTTTNKESKVDMVVTTKDDVMDIMMNAIERGQHVSTITTPVSISQDDITGHDTKTTVRDMTITIDDLLDYDDRMMSAADARELEHDAKLKEETIDMTTTTNTTTEDTTIETPSTTTPCYDATLKTAQTATLLDNIEAWLVKDCETLYKTVNKGAFKELVLSDAKDAYSNLMTMTRATANKFMSKKKTMMAGVDMMNDARSIDDAVVDATTVKGISLDKIKAFIAMCLRNAYKLIKGVAKLVIDMVGITALYTGRIIKGVACVVANETKCASLATVSAFKLDIIASLK